MRSTSAVNFQQSSALAPFDAVADAYDRKFTNSQIGVVQRDAVWRELDRIFLPGQRILEMNCGSGADAVYLASRGVAVLACDSSSRMIEAARRNAPRAGFEDNVEFRVLATEDLGTLAGREESARFDGALSNFAGLNCVENLTSVAGNLAQLLRPGAKVLLCFFSRFCLWEILWYLAHGRPQKAFRRYRARGAVARLTEGVTVQVYYPSARAITRAFAPNFRLRSLKGIGVAVPPSYLESWAGRFPRVLALLGKADRQLGRSPLIRSMADHVLLIFERTS